ncbi:MAG: 4-hydroxy-3-methylbut-2-enyl diphosphate reductase [Chlamydiae bacterium]|nr:4-hydroxy-3-methylbut-2-enyl diphosphate reductase [Chlamydiota bacterium]
MKLLLSKPRGFCAGVVRAISTVEKALELYGDPIYVKHEIVHNRHVVNDLKNKGAIFIEDLDSVPEGSKIIYSAHGVSPVVREMAKKRNLFEIDATCGLVAKIHFAIKRLAKKEYKIILIGHKKHVEIIGAAEEAPEHITIIEKIEDIDNLNFSASQKLFYITQTTFSVFEVEEIVKKLKEKYPKIETLPSSSICYATTNRQKALCMIADEVDVVFVVGDQKSSNSNRLREIVSKKNKPAYLINSYEDILPKYLENVKVIGMSAGASTPEDVVQKCIEKLQSMGVNEIKDVEFVKEDVFFQLPEEVAK